MTFTEGWLTLVPGYWVLVPALPIGVWIVLLRRDPRWTLLALLAWAHMTAVVALTIFPIPIAGQEFYRESRGFSGDNLVPFANITYQLLHPSLVKQLAGNIVALAPLAIYGPGLWPRLRDWRRFLIVAVGFSVAIEMSQFAGSVIEGFTYRVTDIDDVIANSAGAVAAFLVWSRIERSQWTDRWGWIALLRGPAPESAMDSEPR